MINAEKANHRKVYAKGYFDAMKAAGFNTGGMDMNQAKFETAHRGLSAQAKKVYDVIPIQEPWAPTQIMQELHRRNISMSDMRVVMGCLNTLIDSGCVIERPKGMFIRTEVRMKDDPKEPVLSIVKSIKEPEMKPVKETQGVSAANEVTSGPIDRLSVLASRLRQLAADMDNAAIELAEQAQKNDSETLKMRQLQALLKSLG